MTNLAVSLYRDATEINQIYPTNQTLQDNVLAIRNEVKAYLRTCHLSSLTRTFTPKWEHRGLDAWKMKVLRIYDRYDHDALQQMPVLGRILLTTNAYGAVIVTLPPKQGLPLHTDTTNLKLRYHLPLVVRGKGDCIFSVESTKWRIYENEPFIFDETKIHGVTNTLNRTRVHLLIDIHNPFIPITIPKWLSLAVDSRVKSAYDALQPDESTTIAHELLKLLYSK